jgi:hypothetical protein
LLKEIIQTPLNEGEGKKQNIVEKHFEKLGRNMRKLK